MKKINFNFRAKDEFHNDLPVTVGEALIGGFKRASLQDEHLIRKVQVFIDKIESGEFELDEADLKLFKELMLNTDLG